ncbi:UNVERIFIED_CONTAM: hypothetical protein FKN15_049465 [Acipenser sinensis]
MFSALVRSRVVLQHAHVESAGDMMAWAGAGLSAGDPLRAAGPAGRLQQRWGPRGRGEQGWGGLLPETGVRELGGWGERLAGVQRDSGVQEAAVEEMETRGESIQRR